MTLLVNHNQPNITLSAEQEALFKVMEGTNQHLFITGRAGTGKSVLLRHFRENTKKRAVVAAPTGIAALNVRGQTIHSLFRLAPQLHRKGRLPKNSRVCSLLKRIDTLIIDEISMVRADLLDAINERLQEAFNNDLPFGGVQVIMFGDVYQLPPVVEEGLMSYFEAVHNGYFFFNALVWMETEFKIYELTQVFRQKDPVFKNVLNAVRDGTAVDDQIAQLNERYEIAAPSEGTITLATTNSLVTNINQRRLDQLEGKAYEYKALITREMKRSIFPTEEVIQLKVDAQVVLLQNDKDKRWVNGTVATISKLKEEGITVRVDGIDYDLETTTWEEIRYDYDHEKGKVEEEVVSSFTQYPVRLAWAMTIHKSQGQTYESVALDLTTATFAPGQLYVALSRCTSLEGLYLKMPIKRSHIIVEPKVRAFMAKVESIVVETCAQNQNEVIVEAIPQEKITCTQNQEEKGRGGKRDGAGRKSKDLVSAHVKLSPVNMEYTKGIDRSQLLNNLLDAYSIDAKTGKYYNYLLMYPDGTVFYVGKGQGDRINAHERDAKRGEQSAKCDIIRQIWAEGGQILKQKVAFHDNEEAAYELEDLLISFFRVEENLANGVPNSKCEKIGRTKKERSSTRGRKAKDGVVREPLQLSLDVRTIRALNAMGVNKSQLFEDLLQQYEPFLKVWSSLSNAEEYVKYRKELGTVLS